MNIFWEAPKCMVSNYLKWSSCQVMFIGIGFESQPHQKSGWDWITGKSSKAKTFKAGLIKYVNRHPWWQAICAFFSSHSHLHPFRVFLSVLWHIVYFCASKQVDFFAIISSTTFLINFCSSSRCVFFAELCRPFFLSFLLPLFLSFFFSHSLSNTQSLSFTHSLSLSRSLSNFLLSLFFPT